MARDEIVSISPELTFDGKYFKMVNVEFPVMCSKARSYEAHT
jgi:hypothetical protein